MAEYLALYRKYRPNTFDGIVGQEHITTTLKNQVESKNIAHAYLFTGTRGTGKTSCAKIFAKAINCLNSKNGSPCLECEVCKSLNDASNLDVLEIDAASNNRVDEIRDLRDKVKYPPVVGKYKVYIIDEVHMLTESAFNALLKTLEEPPSHCVFILATTEVHKLPATILSRCLRFDFKLIDEDDMFKFLANICEKENISFEKEALYSIVKSGMGSARDCMSILDMCSAYANKKLTYKSVLESLGTFETELFIDFAKAIVNTDGAKILTTINFVASEGKNIVAFGKDLITFFRDLYMVKTLKNANELLKIPNELFNNLRELSNLYDEKQLIKVLSKFAEIETGLKFSLNPRLLIEITALSCLDYFEKKTPDEFLEKNENTTPLEAKQIKITQQMPNINLNELWGDVIKDLRENSQFAIFACCETVEEKNIENNNFVIYTTKNGYEMLNSIENKAILQNTINKFGNNLNLEIKTNNAKTEENVEEYLKNKLGKVEIK